MSDTPITCAAGDHCREYDHTTKPGHPAYLTGGEVFCPTDLAASERDIRALVYDYVDLEQLQAPVLSQALNSQPAAKPAPPMPMAGGPEALQAEILHAVTTWEAEVRSAAGLPEPPDQRRAQAAPWHTTISNRQPLMRVRPGAAVQRAVAILAPRIRFLAALPPTTVCRTGCEDTPEDVAGWEAVLHLSHLHQRARGMLGRTRRTTTVPGSCSAEHPQDKKRTCGGALHRDEPRYAGDPCPVYCGTCPAWWSYDEYERYVGLELALGPRRTPAPDAA